MKKTSAVMMAVTILLAGCGGAGKPDPSPTSTGASPAVTTPAPTTPPPTITSASPTTAVPKADPNIPAAARAHTPAGAEAFVRYFYAQLNLAWTVPRAGLLSPLCQASSKSCAALEKTSARLASEGHRYDGNPLTIKFIGTLDATKPTKYDVLANLVQERRNEIDDSGRTVITDKRVEYRVNFELNYVGDAWSVASIREMK